MTKDSRMELLSRVTDELGQAEVGRRIGRSPSTINQVLHNKYNGNPDRILELIEGEFGESFISCPELGEIPLATCIEERNKPLMASNSDRVRLWRACLNCDRRKS
jgi:transcriptional regulator with XRE-family HTH domain